MKYHCSASTDLEELIGHECPGKNGLEFAYGPLPQAMLNDEELELENSAALPVLMSLKLKNFTDSLFIIETDVEVQAGAHFRLILA